MSHAIALGFEIESIVFVHWSVDGNLFRDCKVKAAVDERVDFFGVVRHETNLVQTKIFKDLNTDAIIAKIDRVSERQIRVAGVHAFILKRVRLDFFDKLFKFYGHGWQFP